MNVVILSGRCTSDADVRYSQGENSMAIARFTLAVNRIKSNDQEQTADFINCVAFGKNGESAEKFFKKGTKLIVRGHWQSGNYTDKEGKKVYTNENVIDSWEFAESKGTAQTAQEPQEDPSNAGFMNVPEDSDLPFLPPTR